MKAFLLFPDRDFDFEAKLPPLHEVLVQDLELETLFTAMAHGDTFLRDVVTKLLLTGESDTSVLRYRQAILHDCERNEATVRSLYALAVDAIQQERKEFWHWSDYPQGILDRARRVLTMFVDVLKRLRSIAESDGATFESGGFRRLFAMLEQELSDAFFAEVESHLHRLRFTDGIPLGARLANDNKGTGYRLLDQEPTSFFDRILGHGPESLSLYIDARDESGAKAVSDLADTGVNLVANALAQSTDHILAFLGMLRSEIAFYLGCLNLRETLERIGAPCCYPDPTPAGSDVFSADSLYDICLALTKGTAVVGNDVSADGRPLVMVTGANRGGKSTFLRSVGLAQLMMQAGMFVPADAFHSAPVSGLFTHYKREEDASMRSGKLDEELNRMSAIVDVLRPGALVMFNESFAATNEQEGSDIAEQVVAALLAKHVRVIFVTHMFELADRFFRNATDRSLFLRANRNDDGSRPFRLVEGEPLRTSFGEDLYRRIFAEA